MLKLLTHHLGWASWASQGQSVNPSGLPHTQQLLRLNGFPISAPTVINLFSQPMFWSQWQHKIDNINNSFTVRFPLLSVEITQCHISLHMEPMDQSIFQRDQTGRFGLPGSVKQYPRTSTCSHTEPLAAGTHSHCSHPDFRIQTVLFFPRAVSQLIWEGHLASGPTLWLYYLVWWIQTHYLQEEQWFEVDVLFHSCFKIWQYQ